MTREKMIKIKHIIDVLDKESAEVLQGSDVSATTFMYDIMTRAVDMHNKLKAKFEEQGSALLNNFNVDEQDIGMYRIQKSTRKTRKPNLGKLENIIQDQDILSLCYSEPKLSVTKIDQVLKENSIKGDPFDVELVETVKFKYR